MEAASDGLFDNATACEIRSKYEPLVGAAGFGLDETDDFCTGGGGMLLPYAVESGVGAEAFTGSEMGWKVFVEGEGKPDTGVEPLIGAAPLGNVT